MDLTTDTGLATFDSALTVCLSHTVADILKAGGAAANLRVGFFDGVMWQPLPLTSSSANETCGLTDQLTQFGLLAATLGGNRLVLMRGFTDGIDGLIFSVLDAFYVFAKYARLLELTKDPDA